QHRSSCALARLDGCAHASATSANNHDVVLMYLHQMKSSFCLVGFKCLLVEAEAWRVVHQIASSISHTRFKGEDHQGTEHDNGNACQVEGNFEANAGAVFAGVVINDCADANSAVNHCEPEHGEIPDLP